MHYQQLYECEVVVYTVPSVQCSVCVCCEHQSAVYNVQCAVCIPLLAPHRAGSGPCHPQDRVHTMQCTLLPTHTHHKCMIFVAQYCPIVPPLLAHMHIVHCTIGQWYVARNCKIDPKHQVKTSLKMYLFTFHNLVSSFTTFLLFLSLIKWDGNVSILFPLFRTKQHLIFCD